MTIRRRGSYGVSTAAMLLLCFVLVAGCSGTQNDSAGRQGSGGESRSGERSEPANASSTDEASTPGGGSTGEQTTTPDPATSMSGRTTPESGRVLPDKWYVDSDGNRVPDFVERAEGYDPERDDCAEKVDCGISGASGTSAVDLASRKQNTLLVLDSSGSMAEPIGGGQTKMDAAKDALERYATGTPDFINLGFMVYGHKGSSAESDRARSCRSTEMLEPLGGVDYRAFPRTLDTFRPSGWTPVAGALNEAGDVFSGEKGATNRVILVSDGLETCGGDPVSAAKKLADSDIEVTIDVVGFDIPRSEEAQLRRIAEVSGGRYATVRSADELQGYFDEQQRVFSELLDQYFCVMGANNDLYFCNLEFGNEAYFRMLGTKNEEDGAERRDAMDEIMERSVEYNDRLGEAISESGDKRLEEISEDIDEVERRMRQRYNEDVSLAPSCPESPVYASRKKENAPDLVPTALLMPDLSAPSGR